MKKGQKVISMDHGVILGILGRQTGLGVARWLFDSELSTRCSGDQDCAIEGPRFGGLALHQRLRNSRCVPAMATTSSFGNVSV